MYTATSHYGLCRTLLSAATIFSIMIASHAAPNPVLRSVADAGVMRCHGVYYLMGVGTSGAIWVSEDLVQWKGPFPAFSMQNAWATGEAGQDQEIHACDLLLHNGLFHLYWSVNHGDLRAIGHAVSDFALGPYQEPAPDMPFDGRIDPHVFVDDNGACYFYTVKFGLGNIIYGQPMKDAFTLMGTAKPLLSPLPNTWETMDNAVNEAPCVVKYRDCYYMLYNANHTSLTFGNYAIGCAAAEAPLAFTNDSKYPFPLLRDNREQRATSSESDQKEPIIRNCGQPNLVRGPNGFEWWLVYFAVYGDDPTRGQAIDRVHFFDREMYIEGPSSSETSGVWNAPARSTFRDAFDSDNIGKLWRPGTGLWSISGGALVQNDEHGLHRINLDVPVLEHYLFETCLRFAGEQGSQIGVIAWERGAEQALYIGMDRNANSWFWVHRHEFLVRTEVFNMPEEFNWNGPHTLRLLKNGSSFTISIDGIPAPGNAVIFLDHAGPGRPGLVTRDSAAAFDSVVLTAGWDEHNLSITGWGPASEGTRETGVWGQGIRGLSVEPENGDEAHIFKGDLLANFEWTVQVIPEETGREGECGMYAWRTDANNFVRVALDAPLTSATVSGKLKGEELPTQTSAIKLRERRLHETSLGGLNMRVVRHGEELRIFIDGTEHFLVQGPWPKAQVGLFAQNMPCRFNGITLYERGI